MSFAEIILRIGGGIGGWLIFLAHALVIAVVPRADCDPRSDDLWVGTLALAVGSAGAIWLLGLGLRWRESLRWFSVAALPLAAYAILGAAPGINGTTIEGASLCAIAGSVPEHLALAAYPANMLQRAWAPVQIVVLLGGMIQGLRYWRAPGPAPA